MLPLIMNKGKILKTTSPLHPIRDAGGLLLASFCMLLHVDRLACIGDRLLGSSNDFHVEGA